VLIDAEHSLLFSAFVVDFHNIEFFVLHKVHVADGLARHQVARQIGSILHRILHYSRCVSPLLALDLNETADKINCFSEEKGVNYSEFGRGETLNRRH